MYAVKILNEDLFLKCVKFNLILFRGFVGFDSTVDEQKHWQEEEKGHHHRCHPVMFLVSLFDVFATIITSLCGT